MPFRPEDYTCVLKGRVGAAASPDTLDLSALDAKALLTELTARPPTEVELSSAEIVTLITETLEARTAARLAELARLQQKLAALFQARAWLA